MPKVPEPKHLPEKEFEGKYLVTMDDWFYAPDGISYRVVWGSMKIVSDKSITGFSTRGGANWLAIFNDGEIAVMGCRVHYIVRCDDSPAGRDVYRCGEK